LPLPKCCGWNKDPVGKRAKAAKVADAKAAKEAKEASKRQREIDAEAAKEKLVEMEVDESFAQRNEIQWHICRQSDLENIGSHSNDKDNELPNVADSDVSDSDGDAEGSNISSDNDNNQGLSQQKSKVHVP
jgi:hypothetical protein